jgi:hypothetical protein
MMELEAKMEAYLDPAYLVSFLDLSDLRFGTDDAKKVAELIKSW